MSRRHGRFDRQFRSLGHRRHLQGIRPVVAGQGRQDRDFDRAVPPDLHRQAAAARPQFRPSADLGTGPRLRARPAGAAADHRRSRPRRGSAAHGALANPEAEPYGCIRRPQFPGIGWHLRARSLPGHDPAVRRGPAARRAAPGAAAPRRSPAPSRPGWSREGPDRRHKPNPDEQRSMEYQDSTPHRHDRCPPTPRALWPPLRSRSRPRHVHVYCCLGSVTSARMSPFVYRIIELVAGERLVMSAGAEAITDGDDLHLARYAGRRHPHDAAKLTAHARGFVGVASPLMARSMRRANIKDLRQLKAILEAERL